jgi:hypothetical protein
MTPAGALFSCLDRPGPRAFSVNRSVRSKSILHTIVDALSAVRFQLKQTRLPQEQTRSAIIYENCCSASMQLMRVRQLFKP